MITKPVAFQNFILATHVTKRTWQKDYIIHIMDFCLNRFIYLFQEMETQLHKLKVYFKPKIHNHV